IFFARDQSNVVDDTCVLSRMKYDIRKPEVNIIRQALYTLGYEKTFQVTQGNLEGGDLMVLGDDVYVGWGPRSEFAAIHEIQQRFPDKNVYGVKAPVNGEWHDDMEIMHLDTFFMPLAEDMAIGCHEVLERCIVTDANKANPRTFLKHLESHGMNTYDIPKEEQRNYAANMVLVRPGLVVVPSGYNAQTRSLLQRHQIGVVDADMRYITNAVGATHCMTLQLKKW
ncbi:hypothetical protein H6504_05515, partial [Candidatus Woesearchaeota archaeon]|nr:hypothetical protein [Candidatus Woesearchaeota archaeon]